MCGDRVPRKNARNIFGALRIAAVTLAFLAAAMPFSAFAAEYTAQELVGSWLEPKGEGPNSYPEDFGGVYCTVSYNAEEQKETCIYYVALVGRSAEREAEIRANVSDPENLKFTDAKYTYAQLYGLQTEIESSGMELEGIKISSVCIIEEGNYVEVATAGDAEALSKLLASEYGDMARVERLTSENDIYYAANGEYLPTIGAVAAPETGDGGEASEETWGISAKSAVCTVLFSVSCIVLVFYSRASRKRREAEENSKIKEDETGKAEESKDAPENR